MIDAASIRDSGRSAERYTFGDFTLDVNRHTLTKSHDAVSIEPKVFDLLRLLVENAGELITRDRMIAEVWKGRLVSDSAISACVASARRAVDDNGRKQAVIRTVARRGFTCCAVVEAEVVAPPQPQRTLSPKLRFTKTREQKSLAYALAGDGPPIIYTTFGGTSIEANWSSPFFRPLFDAICAQNTLVFFDEIGSGQSELDMASAGVEAVAHEILSVADAAGLDRFGLFSQSGSALPAIYLAAHYPERVSAMVLNGGYAEGRNLRPEASGIKEMFGMISEAWDNPDSNFLLAYALLYFPEGPIEMAKDIVEIMNKSCPAENIIRMRQAMNNASVVDLLPRVKSPTLVVHARRDAIHPLEQARMLAAGIPESQLLILDSANHVPMPYSPDWDAFLETTISFLNA